MNNPLGWFYSMKELWSMGMISILEIFKSTPVKTGHFSSSDSEAAPICFCFSQSLWVSEINQGSLLRHRMKDRQHIRTHHSLTLWGKWFKHSVPKIFVTSCLRYKMEIFFEKIIDICPSGVSSVSCKLELACGVTLCLLDWPTLIIKPHWASESNINLGENWLTTSQGTGWPQSYWYLNNLCIFIATTKHCGQKSGQTRDKQLFWFSCHLIARLRQSHDSDCHVSLCVWPLSWCPHLQPDTGTQTRHQYQECHSSMMSVTSCYVGQGQPCTDGDITWEKKREKHLVLVSVLFNGQWVGQMTRVMDQIPQTHFRAYHQQYILLVFDSQPGHIKIKTFIFSIIGTSRTKSK